MSEIRQLISLVESKESKQLVQASLPYKRTEFAPVLSQETLDYHYGKLYKGYVDRYNAKEVCVAFFCVVSIYCAKVM